MHIIEYESGKIWRIEKKNEEEEEEEESLYRQIFTQFPSVFTFCALGDAGSKIREVIHN